MAGPLNLDAFVQTDVQKATQVLQDALTSSGLPQHVQVAIWCAADSYARAKVRQGQETSRRGEVDSLGPN